MEHGLRDGLTFCEIGGRHVFLDIPDNRYFALPEALEGTFSALCAGELPGAEADMAFHRLEAAGVVAAASSHPLCASTTLEPPQSSVLDGPRSALAWMHAPAMATRLLYYTRRLRAGHLADCLQQVRVAKDKAAAGDTSSRKAVLRAAGALEMTRLAVGAEDECLPRSVALTIHLAAHGIRVDFVIAVKLAPFAAHSWVQLGSEVLNDRPENIAPFSPILVL